MGTLTKRNHIFLALVIVLAALCVTGAAISLTQIPDVNQQLSTSPLDVIVTLTKPRDGMKTALYMPIPIHASVNGKHSVQSLELWADGVLVQSKDAANGSASWTWAVPSQGEHTLFVRAKDAHGYVANSNTVRIIGTSETNPGMDLMYSAQQGDTLASVAAKYGTTADDIKSKNPQFGNGSALTAGSQLRIHLAPPPPPTITPQTSPEFNGPSQAGSSNRSNKFVFWATKFLSPTLPIAPELTTKINACSVSLFITDHSNNELGFNLYRLDSNSQTYHQIKSSGASGNNATPIQYNDSNLYGSFNYYVTAFNAAGESQSNVVSVNITDSNCKTPFWSGLEAGSVSTNFHLSDYKPNPPLQKVDKAYFYLSKDDGPRQRIPNDPNAFLSLPNGIFSADEQINNLTLTPTQGTLTLDLDAWGWSGGNLIHIGDFKRTLTAPTGGNTNQPTTVGAPSELDFCFNCGGENPVTSETPSSTPDFETVEFKWFFPADIKTGIWQVSYLPFLNSCDSNPAGLVAYGQIKSSGMDQYGKWENFSIDFSTLKGKTAPLGDLQIGGHDLQNFFIQVMSVQNGGVVCQLSNTLEYTAGAPAKPLVFPTAPPPAPTPPTLDVQILDFKTIQFPDYSQQYCVIVVQNPYTDPNTAAQYIASHPFDTSIAKFIGVPVGTKVCPDQYSPPPPQDPAWYDVVSGWIEDAVNAVASLYNDAVSLVKDLVAEFNPLCIQAKFITNELAPKYNGSVDDACHAVASAAVDTALASAGLPPSVPNFDQLKEVGKGYLVDVAAQELEDQTGVTCDDSHPIPGEPSCKDLLRTGLDDLATQVQQSQNNSACFGGDAGSAHSKYIEPLCNPDGVVTKPDPAGQMQPATLIVQVTEPADAPPWNPAYNLQCGLNIGVSAQNNIPAFDWSGGMQLSSSDETGWPGGTITGQPFQQVGVNRLPPLTPGEPMQIPFVLTPNHWEGYVTATSQPSGFWLPNHLKFLNDVVNFQGDTYAVDDWMKLYFGSTLHATATASCTSSAQGYSNSASQSSDSRDLSVQSGPY